MYEQNNWTQKKKLAHCTYKVLLVVTIRAVPSKRSALGLGSTFGVYPTSYTLQIQQNIFFFRWCHCWWTTCIVFSKKNFVGYMNCFIVSKLSLLKDYPRTSSYIACILHIPALRFTNALASLLIFSHLHHLFTVNQFHLCFVCTEPKIFWERNYEVEFESSRDDGERCFSTSVWLCSNIGFIYCQFASDYAPLWRPMFVHLI